MLELRLLGPFEVCVDGQPLTIGKYNTERPLLALLFLRRLRPVTRDELAETLWPEKEPGFALRKLRETLWGLKNSLGSHAHRIKGKSTLQLDLTDVTVDLIDFEAAIRKSDSLSLESAVSLYRGPLLEQWEEDWVVGERPLVQQKYLKALDTLATRALAGKNPWSAIDYLRRYLKDEPYEEAIHCRLMQALADCGDKAQLIDAYSEFQRILHKDLNSRPKLETTALYNNLKMRFELQALPRSKPEPLIRSLPAPQPRLIGRRHNIEEVLTLFQGERLVTLTGTGGVGKTRLAIAVAEKLDQELPDRVWFVDLTAGASQQVAQTIAKVFMIPEQQGQNLEETLAQAFASRSMLLVLDNCEHLLDVCAHLAQQFLARCPDLRILATSREPLSIAEEQVYRVSPLGVPPVSWPAGMSESEILDRVMEYEAPQLFRDRAERKKPDFRVMPSQAKTLAEICCRLDGIPLAIELAAAKVRSLSMHEINTHLRDNYHLLTNRSPNAPLRHKTLQAVMDWSYDFLTEAEKTLFARLSVFRGGWTLDAVANVCFEGSGEPAKAPGWFENLIDKSLIEVEQEQGKEQSRYRLLETIHQYGSERLKAREEGTDTRERHLAFFAKLAAEAEPQLRGTKQFLWLHRIEREHENLQAALTWALQTREFEMGLCLAGCLGWFWYARGYHEEGTAFLTDFLRQAPEISSSLRLKAVHWLGNIAYARADYAGARTYFEEGLSLRMLQRNVSSIAVGRASLANAIGGLGEFAGALALFETNLAIFRQAEDLRNVALTLTNMGGMAYALTEYERAVLYHEEALGLLRSQGDTANLALVLNNLADTRIILGDLGSVPALLAECLALCRNLGLRPRSVLCLINHVSLAVGEAKYERAAVIFGYLEAFRKRIDYTPPPQTLQKLLADGSLIRERLEEQQFLEMSQWGENMSEEAMAEQFLPSTIALPVRE